MTLFSGFMNMHLAIVLLHIAIALALYLKVSSSKSTIKGDVNEYLGIPYAYPPVGERRFKPAEIKQFPNNLTDYRFYRASCIQEKPMGNHSEDCLYLNIFRPLKSQALLPVFIWIHGGSFVAYSGRLFTGTELSRFLNVIIVTLNYRLGTLGFFNGSNLGLSDQETAIQWVHRYAKQFGGDPEKISLLGESAGSASVIAHLMNQKMAKIFKSAAIQSAPIASLTFVHLNDSVRFSEWFAKDRLNCSLNDLQCLQAINDTSKFVVNKSDFDVRPTWCPPFYPEVPIGITVNISHRNLYSHIANVIANANIPIIVGGTENEGSAFALRVKKTLKALHLSPLSEKSLREILDKLIDTPDNAEKLFNLYHFPSYVKASKDSEALAAFRMMTDFLSDSIFLCPLLEILKKAPKVHGYLFSVSDLFGFIGWKDVLPDIDLSELKAYHNAEMSFLFRNFTTFKHSFDAYRSGDKRLFLQSLSNSGIINHLKFNHLSDTLGCLWHRILTGTEAENCGFVKLEWPAVQNGGILNFKTASEFELIGLHGDNVARAFKKFPTAPICRMWSQADWKWSTT